MNVKKSSALLGVVAAAGVLALSACGSDDNSAAPGGAAISKVSVDCGGKKALKASGSSAQKNAMDRFVTAYQTNCPDHNLDYTSSGSGAGLNDFFGGQTDFAGSDSPLDAAKGEYDKAQARCGSPAWNLPTVYGPIAITFNVPGVDHLALDGPTAAKIFNGQITKWNDPAIAALNTASTLPDLPVHVVFRSDESGTSDNFQHYLDAASKGAWGKGAGKSFAGGVGEGAKGNEGTSAAIGRTPGSITYNEWSFAKAQNLHMASIVTDAAGGKPVELSVDSAQKAVAGVKVKGQGNDLVLDTSSFYNPTDPGAYPIMLATYEVVCSKYSDASTATAVKAFLTSATDNGQTGLDSSGYIPIPDSFKTKLGTAINAIS
ncbi:phosphate ABC transporter substrate-binding protein PstS [Nocardia nova]|uniref:phosphate ABC transporter substrate-binding protein PstS n=1 Tax=Nocardia nova TaxID=37330 RepID=UPI001894215D|nr:phosphate ABC transporter substrate-binding protein PstS [Nocardia nova]MBF6148623.1 phosphate ABC transporter substrate-binding protein PstS [Nocardia nova]MDN2495543.1 phosphate ABC transporter substrate-binding protein PstS [Nocardia nova]